MKIPTYKETWFDPEIEWVQKDDIETLLNPWKDAEKEKPEDDCDILIKLKYTEY